MIAATVVAVSPQTALEVWPFALYTTGTICWLYAGMKMHETALVVLQLYYMAVNTYGIYARL
jgi:hypothetical protein